MTRSGESGFSLVEVVIAAVILGIAVSAVTAMIGNSDLMSSSIDYRRQARIIAQEELEDPVHHFLKYAVMGGMGWSPIEMDHYETTPAVPASRNVVIGAEANLDVFGDGILIPVKTVTCKVVWSKAGRNDTLILAKRITKVKGP